VISIRLTTIFFYAAIIILVSGDIETNPGPYTIVKWVQGSFYQVDPRLETNAGTQCVCNSLFAIAWSVIRNISFWNAADLDLVLYEEMKLYGSLGSTNQYLSVDALRNTITVENEIIQTQNLENYIIK